MSEHAKYDGSEVDRTEDRLRNRRQRREMRRADRQAGGRGWLGGVLLIGLGVLFLLQNAGYLTEFANWWALFLLLPAAGSLSAGLGTYRRSGAEWTKEAVGPLVAGLMFLALTVVFLFGLDLSLFGPLLLIGGGLLLLFGPR